MSPELLKSSRRRATSTQQDPLAPQGGLPATAAAEIVRAARAYLQEPTRPVTPSEQSRHLLQSSCGYSNRPQTSASSVGSHEFRSAAGADGLCWTENSTGGGQADIWTADAEPSAELSSTGSIDAGQPSSSSSLATPQLPGLRRTTVSAPAQQSLPGVVSASRSSSRSSSRAATAGGASTGSRLSELGALAPLRPATAVKASTGQAADLAAAGDLPDTLLGVSAGRSSSGLACGWRSSGSAAAGEADAEGGAWMLAAERSGSLTAAVREASSSTECSSVVRPGSGSCASSRCTTAGSCGSRSRLSSRGSDKPCLQDSLYAAEAELDQMLLDAEAATVEGAGDSSQQQQMQSPDAAAACRQWRQSVARILQGIQALSLSPSDAPALLQHCSDLQCLLATAADWGCLLAWLSNNQHSSAHSPTAAAGCMPGAAMQLQPVVARSLSSSRCTDGSGSVGSKELQGGLLQTLVRLVDSKKPNVLVKVGAMLLSLTPPASNMLLPAAKMLYSLSKDSSNDSRFRHHGVLRPLLQVTAALSSVLQQQRQEQHTSTALLYCSGCLKNISADATNQRSLGRLGGVSTMAQVLVDQVSIAQRVAAAQLQAAPTLRSRHPQHETAAQVAVQASAVLRNLSVAADNAGLFAQQQGSALAALVGLLQPFQHDPEVLLNASRCLSKLSMYDSCRRGLLALGLQQDSSSCSSSASGSRGGCADIPGSSAGLTGGQSCAVAHMVGALLGVRPDQPKQWPTGIRLAFALGQLTTFHEGSRAMVAAVPGALSALPCLLLALVEQQQLQQPAQDHGQQPQQQPQQRAVLATDLMTKLLRLLANLSIDRTMGPTLASQPATADALVGVLEGHEYEAAEELVLNATAALTNMAFYETPSNKVLQASAEVLLRALLPLLTSSSEEAMCEAARAVGNLARVSPAVRAALVLPSSDRDGQQQDAAAAEPAGSRSSQHASAGPYVLQSLVLLLDHGSWEVMCSTAGALVNLAALPEAGTALSRAGLAVVLGTALQRVQGVWGAEGGEQGEDVLTTQQAADLLLQCVGNLVASSAAAMSEAILGSSGPRCAELACSSEDLACFSEVVGWLAAADGCDVPAAIRETACAVKSQLAELWGM